MYSNNYGIYCTKIWFYDHQYDVHNDNNDALAYTTGANDEVIVDVTKITASYNLNHNPLSFNKNKDCISGNNGFIDCITKTTFLQIIGHRDVYCLTVLQIRLYDQQDTL